MTCAVCGQDFNGPRCLCGWAPKRQIAKPAVATYTEPLITREEFGVVLYETIKLFSEREQLRKLHAHDVWLGRRDRLEAWKRQEQDLTAQIVALMPQLSTDDQKRLLDRFEPVRVQA